MPSLLGRVAIGLLFCATLAAAQCGNYVGAANWTCTRSAPCPQGAVCGVLSPPTLGQVPPCGCTTCLLNSDNVCQGTCLLGTACQKSAVANVCTCAPQTPPAPTPPFTTAPPTTPCSTWKGSYAAEALDG